jgi:hypothetical protein
MPPAFLHSQRSQVIRKMPLGAGTPGVYGYRSRKSRRAGQTDRAFIGFAAVLVCSWVVNNEWLSHQRLELENDLIASHLLETGKIPVAQFCGRPRQVDSGFS